jgi:hypothetical protein
MQSFKSNCVKILLDIIIGVCHNRRMRHKRQVKDYPNHWCAPEHLRHAKSMKRDSKGNLLLPKWTVGRKFDSKGGEI